MTTREVYEASAGMPWECGLVRLTELRGFEPHWTCEGLDICEPLASSAMMRAIDGPHDDVVCQFTQRLGAELSALSAHKKGTDDGQ